MDFYKHLKTGVKHSKLEIVSLEKNHLSLRLLGNGKSESAIHIQIDNLVYIDMPPEFLVQKIEFGGVELLPKNYLNIRLRGYEGDDHLYRIMRIEDDEKNRYFTLAYGKEEITQSKI